jgi:hypothetical protein
MINKGPVIYSSWKCMREMGHAMTPENYMVGESEIKSWRYFLKLYLMEQRGLACENCGSKSRWMLGGSQVHEGIVKRNEISKSVPRWWDIFSEYNCFILCAHCNTSKGLPRERFYQKAVDRYGQAAVDEWLASLPFKFTYNGSIVNGIDQGPHLC